MNIIEIKNLNKSLGNFKIENLNLNLPSGTIMGLIGENGAGKSTLIKLILNAIKKDSGEIKIFGKSNTENIELTKEDIGIVFDEVGLPECFSVQDTESVMKLCFKNWDSESYHNLIKKLNIPEDKMFRDFSRGMKMKLGIAVALSHKPKLLLLDEATNGLDPLARDEILDILIEFTRDENNSVLISSHIVSDLEKICDYIAFLHNGKLKLCEEKDLLVSEYAFLNCEEKDLENVDKSSIININKTPYGVCALVKKNAFQNSKNLIPVTIEEIFINTLKGEK